MKLKDADDMIKSLMDMTYYDDEGHTIHDYEDRLAIVKSFVDSVPTVDAEPVRHGAWLPCDKKGYVLTETALRDGRRWYGYKCSECNNIYHGNAFTKYCPNCGAKMDGERKEE